MTSRTARAAMVTADFIAMILFAVAMFGKRRSAASARSIGLDDSRPLLARVFAAGRSSSAAAGLGELQHWESLRAPAVCCSAWCAAQQERPGVPEPRPLASHGRPRD